MEMLGLLSSRRMWKQEGSNPAQHKSKAKLANTEKGKHGSLVEKAKPSHVLRAEEVSLSQQSLGRIHGQTVGRPTLTRGQENAVCKHLR